MPVATGQLNSGYRQLVLDVVAAYPQHASKFARLAVKQVRNGAPPQQDIGKLMAQQIYQAAYGAPPLGVHGFKHWLQDALAADGIDDSVSPVDAFEAEDIEEQ